MIAPAKPKNEVDRLTALRRLNILDTAPEQFYDRMTRLASYICGTPIAIISLVDDERQWFKSRIGLAISETSREISFCGHAIVECDDLFIVPDATIDERFTQNPLVTGSPLIRFYAGAPLVTPEGRALGTLCVLDQVPRELTADQLEALRALRECVVSQLELRKHVEQWRAVGNELAHAQQMQKEFLTNVSHELRTPLNVVMGFTEILGRSMVGPVNEKQARLLSKITESSQRLLSLVNDVVDLSQFDTDTIQAAPESTWVVQVCEGSLGAVNKAAQAKNITSIREFLPEDVTIFVDARRLKQILAILLSNAVKFTPCGGRIGLKVSHDHELRQMMFTVWDTGIGIQTSELENLFQPFVQGDTGLARCAEGMGLGLALVDRLVKLVGGQISVVSELGVGSRFSVSLPRNVPSMNASGKSSDMRDVTVTGCAQHE